jgi:hypothetical protein
MKLNFKAPALLVAAGITFSAFGADAQQVSLTESKAAQIRVALANVKLVEAPNRAAHLVMAAPKSERSAVVRAVVEEVLAAHPTAVASTVRAVLTVAPDEVTAVMEGVLQKTPKAFMAALAVVNELNPSMLSRATEVVVVKAPGELVGLEASAAQGTDTEVAGTRIPRRTLQAIIQNLLAQLRRLTQNNSCLLRS